MRTFSARETEWLKELDGIELASFRQRALAFLMDWIFIWAVLTSVVMLVGVSYLGLLRLEGKPLPDFRHYTVGFMKDKTETIDEEKIGNGTLKIQKYQENEADHVIQEIVVPILYFGILCWAGKGRTPGKRIMKIRVVSIMHRHLSFWHSVERALGYAAAALEGGFGFIQFFLHPYRRCAQDRLAETIVVTERSYQALQHRLSHPLIPDGDSPTVADAAALADSPSC